MPIHAHFPPKKSWNGHGHDGVGPPPNRDKSEYSSDTLQQIRLKAILSKEGLIGSDLEDIGIAAFAIKNIEYIIKTYHEIFLPYSEHRNLTIGQIMKDPRKMRYINKARRIKALKMIYQRNNLVHEYGRDGFRGCDERDAFIDCYNTLLNHEVQILSLKGVCSFHVA